MASPGRFTKEQIVRLFGVTEEEVDHLGLIESGRHTASADCTLCRSIGLR